MNLLSSSLFVSRMWAGLSLLALSSSGAFAADPAPITSDNIGASTIGSTSAAPPPAPQILRSRGNSSEISGQHTEVSTAMLSTGASTVYAAGWTDLANTKLQAACPSPNPGGVEGCSAVVMDWSGAVADTKHNRLILWGGGHMGYFGNEIYALNLNTNPPTMTRLNSPSVLSSNFANDPACPDTNPDGTPVSRHTYGALAYLPTQDSLFSFGGAKAPCGSFTHSTWTADLSGTPAWHPMDPVNGFNPLSYYSSPLGSFCAYDPATDSVICEYSGFYQLVRYTPATNTWTQLTSMATTLVPSQSGVAIDPKRHLMFFVGGNAYGGTSAPGFYAVDISSGSSFVTQNWTSQVSGCGPIINSIYPGMAYDSALDRIVAWPNFGNTVYVFDPDAKTCTAQTFPGGPPDSLDSAGTTPFTNGTYGRFAYFPALDAFVVVNDSRNDAFLLKLPAFSTATVAPSAPINLSAVSASSSAINLSWVPGSDPTGIAGYKVYRGGVQVGTTATTAYTDNGLAAGTNYVYAVAAFDAVGSTSAPSAPASATTALSDQLPPTAPTGLSATAVSSSQISLGWIASTDNVGVTGYRIYRDGALIGTTPATSYDDAGLSASTSHSYAVAAFDAAGNTSAQSAGVSATTKAATDTIAPSTPAGLAAAAASASQITLSWTASTDNVAVAGYKVYRWGVEVAKTMATSYADSGLPASTLYSYTVAAFDAAGNISAQSAPASATTKAAGDTTAPSIPTGLSAAAVSASQITLSWTASSDNVGVTGYNIYRSGVQVATTSAPSYTDAGLAASTAFSYTVAAFDAAGNVSAPSAPASTTTKAAADTTAPSIPTGLAAAAVSTTQVKLTWTASADNVGVAGYKVYRGGVQVGTTTTNSYVDAGLATSIVYSYTVAAYDAAGNTSAQSGAVSSTIYSAADTTAPSVPTGLTTAVVSSSQITLSWTASVDNVGVAGYNVYRWGALVATTTAPSYADSALAASSLYSYTVAAFDAAGNTSAQSASAVATTAAALSSPAGSWTFNTAAVTATSVLDSSGNNLTGQINGGVTTAAGKLYQGLAFDGSTGYLSFANNTLVDLTTNMTFAAFVRTTNRTRGEAILSKVDSSGAGYSIKTTAAGKVSIRFGNKTIYGATSEITDSGSRTINDGNWHHVAVVVNLGLNVQFYIDGVLDSTFSASTVSSRSKNALQIGNSLGSSYGALFTGVLDEVRVYRQGLSASEIASLSTGAY